MSGNSESWRSTTWKREGKNKIQDRAVSDIMELLAKWFKFSLHKCAFKFSFLWLPIHDKTSHSDTALVVIPNTVLFMIWLVSAVICGKQTACMCRKSQVLHKKRGRKEMVLYLCGLRFIFYQFIVKKWGKPDSHSRQCQKPFSHFWHIFSNRILCPSSETLAQCYTNKRKFCFYCSDPKQCKIQEGMCTSNAVHFCSAKGLGFPISSKSQDMELVERFSGNSIVFHPNFWRMRWHKKMQWRRDFFFSCKQVQFAIFPLCCDLCVYSVLLSSFFESATFTFSFSLTDIKYAKIWDLIYKLILMPFVMS